MHTIFLNFVHLLFSFKVLKVSCKESPTAEVSLLSQRDDVSIPIHPITGWHSLFLQSYTRTPFGIPYGLLTCHWQEKYGLTTFRASNL